MTLSAVSQNSQTPKKDSVTCIPNEQLRTALRLIERGTFAKQQLAVADSNMSILQERIKNKDDEISKFNSRENTLKSLVDNAEARVKVAEDKSSLDLNLAKSLKKDLRKQKRRTAFAWIIGGVATVGSILLFGH